MLSRQLTMRSHFLIKSCKCHFGRKTRSFVMTSQVHVTSQITWPNLDSPRNGRSPTSGYKTGHLFGNLRSNSMSNILPTVVWLVLLLYRRPPLTMQWKVNLFVPISNFLENSTFWGVLTGLKFGTNRLAINANHETTHGLLLDVYEVCVDNLTPFD